jgi:hypothetical protein
LDQTRQIATARRPIVSVGGYVDAGFFAAQGTGSASSRTPARRPAVVPEAWTICLGVLSAICSPAINSRGQWRISASSPASTFDSVNSNGAPGASSTGQLT